MNLKKIPPAPSAFADPLLIKSLLSYSTQLEPEREILYRDRIRFIYFELKKRVAGLANVFKILGLNGG
ncbi:MAG: fatty acid--CoA ligase, partial [Sphingobacteriaceae bacterium]|nr:fatty acid--CoA ligase [Cytophagaceae bacterium]